jgi:nucleoside phosphorylase
MPERPEWLHYKSRYGIHEVLVNYKHEDLAQNFLFTGLDYGRAPNQERTYSPSIMILDTFLSDRSDKALFQKLQNFKDDFPSIHVLMANPYGYFANQRHEKIGSGTHDLPINKTIAGLTNILYSLEVEKNNKIDRNIDRNKDQKQICLELIENIKRRGGEHLKLKFYDEYPTSPMYFFNDILMLGRFGAARNCMEMAWYMFVDEQNCEQDLFDENRSEFEDIWNAAKEYPEYPDKVLKDGNYTTAKDQQFDVAIICALKKEFDAVLDMGHLTYERKLKWEKFSLEGNNKLYQKTVITNSNGEKISVVAATLNQMGSIPSSCLTTAILNNFRPKVVILVGIAAGVPSSNERNIGDILIAERVIDYSSGKISQGRDKMAKFLPDPHPISIEEYLLEKLNEFCVNDPFLNKVYEDWRGSKPSTRLNCHIGNLATGDQVIANPDTISEIKMHWRKLIGLEMEAYGVYFAASKMVHPKPHFWCFKSICDFADKKKSDDFQDYAAYVAAEYCNHFLINYYESLFPTNTLS